MVRIGQAKPVERKPVFLMPVLFPIWQAWRELHHNDRETPPLGGLGAIGRDALRDRLRQVDRTVRSLWRHLIESVEAEYRSACADNAQHEGDVRRAQERINSGKR